MAARNLVWVTGRSKVGRNVNRAILGITTRTLAGVQLALYVVRARADVYVPYDKGNLAGTVYTKVWKTSRGPAGEIGYTADYAPYVHEIPNRTYKKPGARWKWLEVALRETQPEQIAVIATAAHVGRGRK